MDDLVAGVLAGDRTSLGRAITLVESTRPDDRRDAQELLAQLLPHGGGAHRVGISGVPGAGKSTLIDSLGTRLTRAGHRVGVLAVDPSSMVTGGSILGDKTRMATLAADERAFIRPSPSAGMLGGVTGTTPHAITVLEAAGYDVVLVETMGVGQSEAAVHASVDCLCVLALAGAGDELQAVKRGLLELADVLVVNKADGDNERAARLAAAEFRRALPLLAPTGEQGPPPVMTVSAATGAGVDELWDWIVEHRRALDASGALARRRARGRLAWMRVLLERRLVEQFEAQTGLTDRRTELEQAVEQGRITPDSAVDQLLSQP
ncbi:MAG: methylmalonyl Co-A mutase-associated GTPase MeaB [Acidimicrobiaceae bacterium]|nr:methylmalonyl Co-A mutase-associated GTPase MeaB [Acidimicrobiaceae bacterium]MDE0515728.1 methylmalonyl Co-A mutase-associated GTPase MeaB [Acidimicrobiaceae bacterium]